MTKVEKVGIFFLYPSISSSRRGKCFKKMLTYNFYPKAIEVGFEVK